MHISSARWSQVACTQRLCRSSQAVSAIGRKLYVFGGEIEPRLPVDSKMDVVQLEDSPANVSETVDEPTNAPAPRVGSPSTTLGGNIWIFSGRGGLHMAPIEEHGALWCYRTDDNQWSLVKPNDTTAPYPKGRSYHCVASDNINKIYVHSGCPEEGRLSDLWAFNVETRAWTELPSAPGPARGGSSIAFVEDKLFRVNGFDGKAEQGGAIDVWSAASGGWSTIRYTPDGTEGPVARSVAAFLPVTVKGRTYIINLFGEHDPSALGHAGAGKMLSDCWAWDVETSLWEKLDPVGDVPTARGWFDGDVVQAGNRDAVIVQGGLEENNKRLGCVWKLAFP